MAGTANVIVGKLEMAMRYCHTGMGMGGNGMGNDFMGFETFLHTSTPYFYYYYYYCCLMFDVNTLWGKKLHPFYFLNNLSNHVLF